MAFIGTPLDTRNTFQSLVGKRFNGDGSTTAFTLDVAPSSTLDIEVFVGNVRQDPNSAYTLSGTTLTFTGAPPSGTNNIYVVHQAKSVGTIDVPSAGVKADNLNSAVLTGQTDIGGAIADADLFLIDDGAGGTLRKTAASRIKTYAGGAALDDITTGDAASTLATSAGNITIDAQEGDTDIIFKGTDSSTDITALTIDMSDGGVLQTRAGIGFPATQVANSGANVLDDYEEGTFTGGFTFGGSATGIAYNRTVGIYTKIGDLVFVQGYVSLTSKGSQTGTALLTGLPFTSNSASNASSACGNMRVSQLTFANDTHLTISIQAGSVVLDLGDTASGAGATAMDNSNFADNTGIEFGFAYTV
jgi:hypothetical protein